MKKIGIMIDGYFVSSGSGINTYVRHLCQTLIKDLGYDVTLFVDTPIEEKVSLNQYNKIGVNIVNANENYRVRTFTASFEENHVARVFKDICQPWVDEHKPVAMISHSYGTALAVRDLEFDGKKCIVTHIGDVMAPDLPDLWDFEDHTVRSFLQSLDNNDIDLVCQTEGIVDNHLKVLKNRDRKSCIVCHEPFHVAIDRQLRPVREGAIVVAGNYKRKRLHDVIDVCAKADIPLTIITGDKTGYGEDLDMYCIKQKVRYNIIEKLANDFVVPQIRSHRIMIHLSDIEVCPYSVIEAMPYVHCLVKKGAPWTHKFYPEYTTRIDLDDIDIVKDAYENYDKYETMDLAEYQKSVNDSWEAYLSS
ncbi:hypothetical protein VPHK567_0309 [Vibrio phage K567]